MIYLYCFMIVPIGDTNVVGGHKPYWSYTFIVINIIVFLVQVSVTGNLICTFAAIPGEISRGHAYHTIITSMFMHGGWMHLIGNMMFLYVFADNIEALIGSMRFGIFYILGGVVASLLHIGVEIWMAQDTISTHCCKPCVVDMLCGEGVAACTGYVPSLGASGAVAAVMGAYIVWFPKSRVRVFAIITTFTIPAIFFLGFWFVEQLFAGMGALGGTTGQGGGVAWWAHIGGFVFGLLFGWVNQSTVQKILRTPHV